MIPADIPIDDILSASKSLGNETTSQVTKNDSVKMLIREIRMRLQAKRKREQEVVELKQLYPAVRIVFKKDSLGTVNNKNVQNKNCRGWEIQSDEFKHNKMTIKLQK